MNEPTNIQEALIAQLTKWVEKLELKEGEPCDFHIGTPARVDPENGILKQAFVIEVSRKMERVSEPTEPPKPLPPIPPV